MYALKFISGKYQGGEFPLKPGKQIVVGRSSELDMVLVEDMVSRKHAKISCTEGKILIEDLGSTNGTFVNGEKIKQARLKEGDRVLIGTSILKLIAQGNAPQMDDQQVKRKLEEAAAATAARQTRSSSSMTGKIEEVPLPDLLQLFGTSKKNGVLYIKNEHEGRIFLRQGKIYYALIDNNHDLGPQKSFYRIIRWEAGDFELLPPDPQDFMIELEEPTEALLMEGLRQLDELRRIEKQMPKPDARLALAVPLTPPLRDLKPDRLDLLQLIHNVGVMQAVLDKGDGSDLDNAQGVLELLEKKYITEG
jgi:pSer/pThr/pTyr-binding forkhead associated (FHA) protein